MQLTRQYPAQDFHGLLKAPHGQLEIITTPLLHEQQIVIICHPHPLHQGSMHNKVITTIAKACTDQGYATVRFNYRGVGRSSGEYGHMIGETEDCRTIYQWLREQYPNARIALAGFSFGSFIAASMANEINDCRWLVTVAPSVEHADFTPLTQIACPWLVAQGDADEIVPPDAVYRWFDTMQNADELARFAETSHFFHGKLIPLRDKLQAWINDHTG